MHSRPLPRVKVFLNLKIDRPTKFELIYLVHNSVYFSPLQLKIKPHEGAINLHRTCAFILEIVGTVVNSTYSILLEF